MWHNPDTDTWVPVEVKHSAPTQWWVYAIIIVAVVITIATIIVAASELPEVIREQQEIYEQQNG